MNEVGLHPSTTHRPTLACHLEVENTDPPPPLLSIHPQPWLQSAPRPPGCPVCAVPITSCMLAIPCSMSGSGSTGNLQQLAQQQQQQQEQPQPSPRSGSGVTSSS